MGPSRSRRPVSGRITAANEAGTRIIDPTSGQITMLVGGLRAGNAFLVVERETSGEGSWYVQTYLNGPGDWDLEYQDGTFAEHYCTRATSRHEVIAAICDWMDGADTWKERFTWEPFENRL